MFTVLLASCADNNKISISDKCFQEEINAYNDILNEIVDTSFYQRELAERNKEIAVFFLFDTLTTNDNRGNKDDPSDNKFLKAIFDKRHFLPEQINGIQKYKFIRATKYPKDTIIGETLNTVIQDSLQLKQGEWFTGKWLTLSRICFNSEMTKGHLSYQVWCGNLCSTRDGLYIEKINGKWKVNMRNRGPVS